MDGSWTVIAVDGAEVRLRSGRIGLVTVDVSAPVTSGSLRIDGPEVALDLVIALDRLRTSNFLLQAAARSLISRHQAQSLVYRGTGHSAHPWSVAGKATAGDVTIELELSVTTWDSGSFAQPQGIALIGSANVGTVHLPLPGLGTVEDFRFDVDARLALDAT